MKAYKIWGRLVRGKDIFMELPGVPIFLDFEEANKAAQNMLLQMSKPQEVRPGVPVLNQPKPDPNDIKIIELDVKFEEEFNKPKIEMP